MKTISIVNPCYNEQENVMEVYERVKQVMRKLSCYRYEHIFIDNASTDGTVEVLRYIARVDKNVKVIVNSRNFGHVRSPVHGVFQARGDAVAVFATDLQEPPELLKEMIHKWENGTPIVIAIKEASDENRLAFWMRRRYYRLIKRLSATETYEDFTGFGLYDRKVVDILKGFDDPYPYFRGMIAEIGLPHLELSYHQQRRKRGKTKNNLYTLYDLAMLGITNLSKVPLRLVTFTGFISSLVCVLVALVYFVYKLLFWDRFSVGMAPLVIGIFFFSSVQLLSLGIIGEYIGAIHTQVQRRPLVVERERINFEHAPGEPLAESPVEAKATERGS